MKDRIFALLQRVGRSFMLPIALLPVAGLLLGIGASFTNPTTLEEYGLTGIISEGGILYTVLDIMAKTGSVVFDNLALLFAIGVAIGMAKREKEVAALSAAIAFLVMHTAISALIGVRGGAEALGENTTASVLGITTLQMGVFGGIIVGLGVAALHNRFYKIKLPQVLSFFGGTRFVPIISALVYLGVGILMFYIWQPIQSGIRSLGALVLNSGYIGTWIYGIIERALIPFGLHHVFYMPFWQTELGGAVVVDGTLVQGAQNIFFAELASKSTEAFSVSATRFMSGKFPFMIFGLPAAALAMYRLAKPEKRKLVGGLLLSAALTSVLTGITEPLEFTFLFVAPLMYIVHCVLAGLSYMLMHIFRVGVGMTFSGGVIDLTLFGILQGNAKTRWIWVVIVGLVYAVIYYFVFYFLIKKFDFKTPGREDEGESKLYTREDYITRKHEGDDVSPLILQGLGGRDNIADLDSCATRLRVTLKNPEKADEALLKKSGASGVIKKGVGIQVIYGPHVSVVKSNLEDYLSRGGKTLFAPIDAEVVPLKKVEDEAFSTGALGEGVALLPKGNTVFAPADCKVVSVFDTSHAINLDADGAELLIHVGLDTVKLKGLHFKVKVKEGDSVKKGDPLITFDPAGIKKSGYKLTTPLVITNSSEFSVEVVAKGEVKTGDSLIVLRRMEK